MMMLLISWLIICNHQVVSISEDMNEITLIELKQIIVELLIDLNCTCGFMLNNTNVESKVIIQNQIQSLESS